MKKQIHILTWSDTRGLYCFDDPYEGHEIMSGEPLSIEVLNGVWVNGHVQHSRDYDKPGCYAINDAGRPRWGPGSTRLRPRRMPLTQAVLQHQVNSALKEGLSLADAFNVATGRVTGLFAGYYFISIDGQVLGLCTGMRVRVWQ